LFRALSGDRRKGRPEDDRLTSPVEKRATATPRLSLISRTRFSTDC